jgi:ribonucleoside-diphosphate reductase alpha subunit
MMETAMYVVKRDGTKEAVHFDKIMKRIASLVGGARHGGEDLVGVDPALVSQKVVGGLYSGVSTTMLDELAAETAAFLSTLHPNYGTLAARIAISNLHKTTHGAFSKVACLMADHVHAPTRKACPLLDPEVSAFIASHRAELDAMVVTERDYLFDYFGFKTLEKTYLTRVHGSIVERPQHLFMRVAVAIHMPDLAAIQETYDLLSAKKMTHATPTLFNAGTPRPQMASCFLVRMREDSIEGIFDTLGQCATISKYAGGIGLSIHEVRAMNSHIAGTNGTSNGLVPMLKVFSDMARYVDQGGGKRKGSVAVYLEPWHADVFEFLALRKNHGAEEARARDLFPALWVSDLFMRRVKDAGTWSLFCPNEAPGLHEVWGDAFEALYTRYEAEGRARRTLPAQTLWFAILESQVETGTPYLLFKDACNRKSNQQHLGTIQGSNLCTEIVQFTSKDEVAVCNLASISLPGFVKDGEADPAAPAAPPRVFDWPAFEKVVAVAVRNLNKVIDRTFYPVPEARVSNLQHRPIGLGVQGLADVFAMLRLPYDSEAAATLNRDIFETMYYAALDASCALAARDGSYHTFVGSPASRNILQPDMWGVDTKASTRHDWAGLRERIAKFGLRNSLLVAPMPTASTAQILGNTEAFEPFTSNIFTRRTLAGEFVVLNKHMVQDLLARGLWTKPMRDAIVAHRGSVQLIPGFPEDCKPLYKTVWEMKMKSLIDLAAGRGPYIDQSQSLNLFVASPTTSLLTSMHFYSWQVGLKTGMYYLRTRPKADPVPVTVDAGLAAAVAAGAAASIVKKETLHAVELCPGSDDDKDSDVENYGDDCTACAMCSA